MPEIVSPDIIEPITDKDGSMTESFHRWTERVTSLDLIIGTGSPESVVEATVGKIYMDDSGTAGNILYIKKLADIGGDRKQGWILV